MNYTEMMNALEKAVVDRAKTLTQEGEDGYASGFKTFPEADALVTEAIVLRRTFNSFRSASIAAGLYAEPD